MKQFLPFIVVGVVNGSIYGIAGMGLVLTYKTSGIFNFAHGAVAAGAAYVFYELHFTHGMAWPLAMVICLGVFGPVAGALIERLARQLADVRAAMAIVATVGLLLMIQGFLIYQYGAVTKNFPQFLPKGSVRFLDVNVDYAQIIVAVVAAASAAGLYAFFRASRVGVAMRGVVDDPDLLGLAGTSPVRVRTASWMIGCSFAALSGVLIAPTLGLDATLLTLLVVQAFGAAAIGFFSSLPLTYAGGLAIGILAALAQKQLASHAALGGVPSTVPFIVLFVVLLVTPRWRLAAGAVRTRVAGERLSVSRGAKVGTAVLALGVLAAVPAIVGPRLPVYINGLIFILIFLSLALLVWTSGQISLCQAAFAALGATTFSHLTHGLGLPWVVALLCAGLVTVPLGAIVAIPATRLSGVYLALATFGFGILVQRVLFPTGFMFGGRGFRLAPRPDFGLFDATGDRGFYFVCLAVVVLACALVVAVNRSRLGRLLQALGDSPVALTTQGLSVNVTRVLVFCLSAFLAGIAGALFIAAAGQQSGVGFDPLQSLIWLAVLAICGTTLVPSAVLAATLLAVLPAYAPRGFNDVQTMLFGILAIVAALVSGGRFDFASRFRRLATSSERRLRRSPVRSRTAAAQAAEAAPS